MKPSHTFSPLSITAFLVYLVLVTPVRYLRGRGSSSTSSWLSSASANHSYVDVLDAIAGDAAIAKHLHGTDRRLKCQIVLFDTLHEYSRSNDATASTARSLRHLNATGGGPGDASFLVVLPVNDLSAASAPPANSDALPPVTPSLRSITAIYHTILQHAKDPSSPLYATLTAAPPASSSVSDASDDEIGASNVTAPSTGATQKQPESKVPAVPLAGSPPPPPEFVLFGSVASAAYQPTAHSAPTVTAQTIARVLHHLDAMASDATTRDAFEQPRCDVIPLTSSPDETSSVSLLVSLRQSLGQRGVKAWMGLLRALGWVSSAAMTESLNVPVFAHAHTAKHPYYLAHYQQPAAAEAAAEGAAGDNSGSHRRYFQSFPYLFPVLATPPVEPFQLVLLRPHLLVPLAQFIVEAERVLETENKWDIQALFADSVAMKMQVFEQLPMFFLAQVLGRRVHMCRPFHPHTHQARPRPAAAA